jgi:hypothetical protein
MTDEELLELLRKGPEHIYRYVNADHAAADRIEALTAERDELQQVFDFQWEAHVRAVEMWRLEHPDNDLVLPDTAKLLVWLLEQVDEAKAKLAKAVEAHQRIVQWADAYPLAVFPEPDFKAVQQALSAAGLSLDAVSASNMRLVTKGVGNLSRITLAEIEGGKG